MGKTTPQNEWVKHHHNSGKVGNDHYGQKYRETERRRRESTTQKERTEERERPQEEREQERETGVTKPCGRG